MWLNVTERDWTQLNATELDYMQRNTIECNGTQLNSTECNGTRLNATKRNWTWLNATELNWMQLNMIERNWIWLNATDLYWKQLNSIECKWTWLNTTELDWTQLNSIERNWTWPYAAERNRRWLNRTKHDWTGLNGTERELMGLSQDWAWQMFAYKLRNYWWRKNWKDTCILDKNFTKHWNWHLIQKMLVVHYKVGYKFAITWSCDAFCEKWATLIELNRLQRMRCFILNREAINLAALIVSKTQIVSSFGSRGKGDLSTIDIYPSVDNNKGYKGRGKANAHFYTQTLSRPL